MSRQLFSFLFALIGITAWAQPGTEVYLFDISQGDSLSISNPINISKNEGYDNQPSFTDNGYLLYTSWRDGNTDIVKHHLKSGRKAYLTETPAGEYSPTQMPGEESFSTITLEESGRQLLWSYPLKSGKGKELIPYLKIGYHTWLDADHLFAFVLGPHATLQYIDRSTQRAEIITEDIGRSLHIIPETNRLSYVKKNESEWTINSYDVSNDSTEVLTTTLEGVEDMAWYDQTTLLMGKDSKLYSWSVATGWKLVADLQKWNLSGITRLAVSPDRKYVAIVVND